MLYVSTQTESKHAFLFILGIVFLCLRNVSQIIKKEYCRIFVDTFPTKAKGNVLDLSLSVFVYLHVSSAFVPCRDHYWAHKSSAVHADADNGLEKQEREKVSFWFRFNPCS